MARTAKTLLGVSLGTRLLRENLLAEAAARKATARNIIYLYMDGGMSHVDTWDPKSGEVMGPTKTIPSSANGILLGQDRRDLSSSSLPTSDGDRARELVQGGPLPGGPHLCAPQQQKVSVPPLTRRGGTAAELTMHCPPFGERR
jgi:hypothetical protein